MNLPQAAPRKRHIRFAALAALMTLLCIVPRAGASIDAPSPTAWVPNGQVNAAVVDSAGRTYVGGDFSQWGPQTGFGMVAPLASSTPLSGFPKINGPVYAAVSDGAGGVFIGGAFTAIDGVPRDHLAHIRADHTLDPDWTFGVPGTVRALARSDGSLFAGGDFILHSGNSSWNGLVKITAAGTLDTAFAGHIGRQVLSLAVSGSSLYVGGSFSGRLLKVAADTGAVDAGWDADVSGGDVRALQVFDGGLIAGGTFESVGGQDRNGLAKVATGGTGGVDTTWNPDPSSAAVNALALAGSDLFVGGSFFAVGGAPHSGLAKVSAATGALDPAFDPPGWYVVDALALTATELVVGGPYLAIGSEFRVGIARVSTGKGILNGWNPRASGAARAIVVTGSEVFAGGDFNSAGPAVRDAPGLVRLKPDGTPDDTFDVHVNGPVNALALSGTSLFVGGDFTYADALRRYGLAKVDTGGTGTVDADWHPDALNTVRALAVSGGDLFVGGDFAIDPIGGQVRNFLAKLSTAGTGAADPTWNPDPSGNVTALALSGGDLFAIGEFFSVGGQFREGLAKLATTGAGAADAAWDPGIDGDKHALLTSGSSLFVGGDFTVAGAGKNLAKLPTGGSGAPEMSWKPVADQPVRALALDGDVLHVGGNFAKVANQARGGIARLSAATGELDAGPTPSVAAGGSVRAIVPSASRILVGGAFSGVGVLPTSNFALFDLSQPAVTVTTPADGATYRQGQVVAAAFACTNPGGDEPSCTGTAASGAPIDTGTPGRHTFTVTATGAGGNVATRTVSYTVDGSAPAITITNPEQGGRYVTGTKLTVAFSCADPDGAADVTSCTGTAPNGTPLDTKGAGKRSFTVTAVDAVGNNATKTITYAVVAPPRKPALSRLKIAPASFRTRGRRAGAKVSYKLSTAASVTFTVTRKVGKRTRAVGRFKVKGKAGTNRFTYRGRVKGKALEKGRYELVARAKGPTGLRSAKVSASFRVKITR